ncbi:MAG: hypothetical protein E7401_04510 [Ruminococcaceae bacterium]|nr:hypothetical protein [Oscillospiraceae bacterium]
MKTKKFRIATVVLCLALCFSAVLAEPGGSDDPLISQSYIENVLMPSIKQYVESRIAEVNSGTGSGATDAFTVVEVKKSQQLICAAGTELILRMGSATIIATEKGGLADTTAGFDLANGVTMPANHLLIVPVADGRGIKATSDTLVMVKGGYTIK